MPASADTVYSMGSIGKQFTALMLLQLVDRHVVHLSDPVSMYVPELLQIQNPYPWAPPVTLIQLATHTAGLTAEGHEPPAPTGTRSRWEDLLLSVLPQVRFEVEPGTHFAYSNIGYALLGLALERAAGEKYLDYLQTRILRPLDMQRTAFDLTGDMAAHVAKGYALQGGSPVLVADPVQMPTGRAYLTPAGGMFTTAGDLAKFVAFELGHGPVAVLDPRSVMDNLSRTSSSTGTLTSGYGIGFGVNRRDAVVMAGHNGATPGFSAAAYFRSSDDAGMVFLRNASPSQSGVFGFAFDFGVLGAIAGRNQNGQ